VNKILSVDICYQDYSDIEPSIPNHYVAIIHHTGSPFAFHVYADSEEELQHLKVGEVFKESTNEQTH